MPPTPTPRVPLTLENAFVVWSHKHQQWWRPNQMGYTTQLHDAGVYTEAEALDIQARSNANPTSQRSEAMPLDRALTMHHVEPMRYRSVAWLVTSTLPAIDARALDAFPLPAIEISI